MILSQVHIGIFMGIEDPIAYTKGFSIQSSGFLSPDLANKREMSPGAIKLAANNLDPQTIKVLNINHGERTATEDMFAVAGANAVYPNQEKETGSLHRGNLEKIMAEINIKDALTAPPEEYGHGSINFD